MFRCTSQFPIFPIDNISNETNLHFSNFKLLISAILQEPGFNNNTNTLRASALVEKMKIFIPNKHLVQAVFIRSSTYVQGQSPKPNIREYFYYIDHQGMLFLDDARIKNFTSCFKDKEFLIFFFKRLKINDTDRYPEFPYISPCGRERNYIRCNDCPIVFTSVEDENFYYNHSPLNLPFNPSRIHTDADSGRLYHPAPGKPGDMGLILSKLAIEFSKNFEFKDVESEKEPTHFTWKGVRYELDGSWYTERGSCK